MAKHKRAEHNPKKAGHKAKQAKQPRKAVLKPYLKSDYKPVRVRARKVLHSGRGLKATGRAAHKLNRIETRLEKKDPDKQPLYNPSAPLAGKELQTAAHQLAGGEFNPQIRQLERQQKNQDAQYQQVENRSDSYYNQLRGYQSMAQAGLARTGGMGVLQAAGLGQQTEQQLARSRAAIKTPGNDSGGAQSLLNQEAALQQMRAAGDAQGYTQAALSQSQNWQGLNTAIMGATQLRGGEARQELINRRLNNDQELQAQEGDLRSQRASKFTEQLLTLRQQGFENQATAETLQLKGQQQAADLTQQGIENRQRQQTINETIRSHNLSHQDRIVMAKIAHLDRQRQTLLSHNDRKAALRVSRQMQGLRAQISAGHLGIARKTLRIQKKHGTGPYATPGAGGSGGNPRNGLGSLTQGQENTGLKDLNYAISVFRTLKGKTSGHNIRQILTTGGSKSSHHTKNGVGGSRSVSYRAVDPLFINAAEDIVYRGGLSRTNLKRLHRHGYHTKSYRKLHGGSRGVLDAAKGLAGSF